jgi:hypothetical protein
MDRRLSRACISYLIDKDNEQKSEITNQNEMATAILDFRSAPKSQVLFMYDRLRQTASDTYSSHNPLVI